MDRDFITGMLFGLFLALIRKENDREIHTRARVIVIIIWIPIIILWIYDIKEKLAKHKTSNPPKVKSDSEK